MAHLQVWPAVVSPGALRVVIKAWLCVRSRHSKRWCEVHRVNYDISLKRGLNLTSDDVWVKHTDGKVATASNVIWIVVPSFIGHPEGLALAWVDWHGCWPVDSVVESVNGIALRLCCDNTNDIVDMCFDCGLEKHVWLQLTGLFSFWVDGRVSPNRLEVSVERSIHARVREWDYSCLYGHNKLALINISFKL